jgi:transposase
MRQPGWQAGSAAPGFGSNYDGGSRTEAARIGGVTLQIVRDWVVRFNAEGPAGLIDRKAPGKAPSLGPEARAALARAVEEGPAPWRDGVVRWRLIDLGQWLWETFGVSVSATTVGRELRAMGFRKLSARPRHHAQDPEVLEAFKKRTSPPVIVAHCCDAWNELMDQPWRIRSIGRRTWADAL